MTAASRYDALLFDFDGVIVESVDIKTEAFAALYAEHGPAVVAAVRAYHLAHGGISRFEKFRYFETELLGRAPLSAAGERALGARFAARVLAAVLAAPLVPGVQAVLERYRGRVPMAVISGTPQDELTTIVAQRGLAACFVAVLGSPIDKARHIADLVAHLGCEPARTLMIGDAASDYAAARANATLFLGRVGAGDASPFPSGTPIVVDFTRCPGGSLEHALPL